MYTANQFILNDKLIMTVKENINKPNSNSNFHKTYYISTLRARDMVMSKLAVSELADRHTPTNHKTYVNNSSKRNT